MIVRNEVTINLRSPGVASIALLSTALWSQSTAHITAPKPVLLHAPMRQANDATDRGEINGDLSTAIGDTAVGFTITVLGTSRTSTYKSELVTDSKGEFHISNLSFGSYVVIPYLDSEDSRYPPGTGSFFDKHLVRFNISSEHPYAVVHLKLDAPFRILTGTVADYESGKPVLAQIRLWHADDPDKWITFRTAITGEYRCLIPAGQISGEFSAPGYTSSRMSIPLNKDDPNPVFNVTLKH